MQQTLCGIVLGFLKNKIFSKDSVFKCIPIFPGDYAEIRSIAQKNLLISFRAEATTKTKISVEKSVVNIF